MHTQLNAYTEKTHKVGAQDLLRRGAPEVRPDYENLKNPEFLVLLHPAIATNTSLVGVDSVSIGPCDPGDARYFGVFEDEDDDDCTECDTADALVPMEVTADPAAEIFDGPMIVAAAVLDTGAGIDATSGMLTDQGS